MNRITERIRRLFHGSKRQMLTAVSAAFIVYVLLLAGIFSYFHSEDTVTNRLDAKSGAVSLLEPAWDSVGQYKARAAEPGMKIEKDPSGVNTGQVDLFIRLKMTVTLGNFDETGKTQNYIDNYKDDNVPDTNGVNDERAKRRLDSILKAIRLAGSPDTEFLTWDDTNSKWVCNNSNFYFETVNDTTTGETTYYFYYTGGESSMKRVKPLESTAKLFDYLEMPIYKKDWFGVFDQKYEITLTAEGIPAGNYPDGLTADAAKDEFAPTSS